MFTLPWQEWGYKWLTFCVTTIMKRNQSAHTACAWAVRGKRRARVEKMNNCTDIKLLRMRGRIQMTHFLCYDHNETQSGCTHRLCVSCAWEKTGKGRKMNCTDINLLRMRGWFLLSNLIKMNNSIACLVSSLYLKKVLFQTHIIHSLDFSHAIGLYVASNLVPRLLPGARGREAARRGVKKF